MPFPARRPAGLRRVGALVALAVTLTAAAGCGSTGLTDADPSIVRTTTMVAGAGVVGLERDTRTACPAPAPMDPGASTRNVAHAGGATTVTGDPMRIVVLGTQALDTTCALGLWERVVGATLPPGASAQPSYLGTGIGLIPSVGSPSAPDLDRIAQLKPDLILGTSVPDAAVAAKLSAIAPTVFDSVDGGWQRQFQVAALALGRPEAAKKALADYHRDATQTGTDLNASQTQASVVRFGGDSMQVQGSDSFAGQVLSDAGVRRPAYQRGKSYPITSSDLSNADGDLIYVLFDGDAGKSHAEQVMNGDAWRELGAAVDRRVFNVDDTIWHGDGLTAARAMLADLRATLNGFVTG
ncbi:iron-siderophore ABC transporter substrate-binding protein [Skermania sp. ID1734]|uniref:ABC transporter substrate-binding protein n=1 Tax=Skermania sp. ID1734 TaxID=2597516 RepID=UPI00117ECAD9|nr:iron-siderophore ABC transporter substrate-binding protein [Skermania sp. ID1734]TSE00986.1 iron-siderophore ABC transporter substrate-binding protein [Skermania sp. ID1734]